MNFFEILFNPQKTDFSDLGFSLGFLVFSDSEPKNFHVLYPIGDIR